MAVGFTGRRYRVTMRQDLAVLTDPAVRTSEARRLAALALQQRLSMLILIIYAPEFRDVELALDEFVPDLATRLEAVASELRDVHVVCGDRWWWLTSGDEDAAVEGRVVDLASSRGAAEAVYAGLTCLGSRRELERRAVPPEPDLVAFADACTWREGLEPTERRRAATELGTQEPDASLTPTDHQRLAALVTEVDVRDEVLFALRRENAAALVDTWTQVVRHTPSQLRPDALCVLGIVGWLAGSGALMLVCAEEAQRIDPGHRMARLLLGLVDHAVDPGQWERVRSLARSGADPGRGR